MDCNILDKNRVRALERDSLLGLTSLNDETALFEFGNVVVQKRYIENGNVRIISGGSHCYATFVGKGMLTCAVQGEHFTTPSSKVILRTLRELSFDHLKGILIILPSSTSNLLNFGVAVERALNDNLRVKLLPINDDCRNPTLSTIEKNGLSGFLLISKIAGAMSERQVSLNEIYKYCEKLAQSMLSIGFNMRDINEDYDKCTHCMRHDLKNDNVFVKEEKKTTTRISLGACESDFRSAQIKANSIFMKTLSNMIEVKEEFSEEPGKMVLVPEDEIIILVNNNSILGKTEEFLLVYDTVELLQEAGISVVRFYISNFVKLSKDLTITIMKVDNKDILKYLDDPCNSLGWKSVNQGHGDALSIDTVMPGRLRRKERLAPPIRGPRLSDEDANILLFATQFACDALISCEHQLNIIDSERGNGNTGTRMRNVAEVLIKRMKLDKLITNFPFTFFESLGKMLEGTMGGSSGCIYSIMFEAAASYFADYVETTEVTPKMWLKCFENAANALKKYGNTDYGLGTMYDPIVRCLETVREELEVGAHFIHAYGKGIGDADVEIQRTKQDRRYPDSGAHAVGIWMRAAYEAVKLRIPASNYY